MDYRFLIILLSITYISYYVVVKKCLNYFSEKQILLNIYVLASIFILLFFYKDLSFSFNDININYIWLVLLACILIISELVLLYACNSDINFGIIDGTAIAIYLPVVTLIGSIFFKNKVNMLNMLGIIFIGIGAFLANT